MEDNPDVTLSLADKRKAFEEYRTKWDAFDPIQKWERKVDNYHAYRKVSGPGVYGFIPGYVPFIEFLTLESVSRGISRKEWGLPVPYLPPLGFAIDPRGNVLAIVGRDRRWAVQYIGVHLWTMTTGRPHPAAENPILSLDETDMTAVFSTSITNSRLAILVGFPPLPNMTNQNGKRMVVWDWRTGRILLVSDPPTSVSPSSNKKIVSLHRTRQIRTTGDWSS